MSWEQCGVETQAEIIGFDQIRQHEDHEKMVGMMKAMHP